MDLLGGYSSSEEGDGIRQEDASPQQQPPQQPIQKLPAPNFDGEEEAFATDTSNNNLKRGFQQVSGSSLVGSANKGAPKSQKFSTPAASNSASTTARASSNPNLLLPPQLKGRPNVATEDVGKLFTQRSLQAMRDGSNKQQQQKSGEASLQTETQVKGGTKLS